MRLVMSGETVIHVADPQQDSNLHDSGNPNMPGPSGTNRAQIQPVSASNTGVPQQPSEPQASTSAAATATTAASSQQQQQMMIFSNQQPQLEQPTQQQRASINSQNYDLSA